MTPPCSSTSVDEAVSNRSEVKLTPLSVVTFLWNISSPVSFRKAGSARFVESSDRKGQAHT